MCVVITHQKPSLDIAEHEHTGSALTGCVRVQNAIISYVIGSYAARNHHLYCQPTGIRQAAPSVIATTTPVGYHPLHVQTRQLSTRECAQNAHSFLQLKLPKQNVATNVHTCHFCAVVFTAASDQQPRGNTRDTSSNEQRRAAKHPQRLPVGTKRELKV